MSNMGATKNVADWLEAAVVADLGITCAKGNAAWSRPSIGTADAAWSRPPIGTANAYIEWQTDAPQEAIRASAPIDTTSMAFEIVIVATDEIALWALLDSARTMARSRSGKQTIGGAAVRVMFGAWSRILPSEDTIEALRYAAGATATFVF